MIKINNKTKLLLTIIFSILGVYFGFHYILPLFTPFIIAYFIAWILLPIVRFLNKKLLIPRSIGAILTLGLFGSALFWVGCKLCNILKYQAITLIRNTPVYLTRISGFLDNICGSCDHLFGIQLGTIRGLFDDNMENVIILVRTEILPTFTSQSIKYAINILGVIGIVIFTIVAIFLLIKDDAEYKKSFSSTIYYPSIHKVTSKLAETGIAYLKTQGIMMIFIAIWCTLGLWLIGNKYAILVGIGIGIFDAFPVLGSGLILVPWSIFELLDKNIFAAAILLTIYVGCQIIRQILEPRLLGNRIGIKPIFTLMAMYVGARVFGFAGFFLGPIGLVVILTIVKEVKEGLVLNNE